MAGMYQVSVRKDGPLFDGRAEAAVDTAVHRCTAALGRQGYAIIRDKSARYNRSGRATGGAPPTVQTRIGWQTARIYGQSSRGSIWWPWLEGTSSRNKSTRFKGYHTFRLVRRILGKRSESVMEAKLAEVAPEMGGAP
jgi:hypothetical protein